MERYALSSMQRPVRPVPAVRAMGVEMIARSKWMVQRMTHSRKAINENGGDEKIHDGDSDDTNFMVPITIECRRVTKEVRKTSH